MPGFAPPFCASRLVYYTLSRSDYQDRLALWQGEALIRVLFALEMRRCRTSWNLVRIHIEFSLVYQHALWCDYLLPQGKKG